MAEQQLARGLWTGFASTESPFGTPNGMDENLRRLDDHLALYTLQGVQPSGTPLPPNPNEGDGQIYDDGSYSVFNAGAWKTYVARQGISVQLADGTDFFTATPTGWESFRARMGDDIDSLGQIVDQKIQAIGEQIESSDEKAQSAVAISGNASRTSNDPLLFVEQHFSGFFGRGMLDIETNNIATEQPITSVRNAGDVTLPVPSTLAFGVGTTVTVRHKNGHYASYFVAGRTSTLLDVAPPIRFEIDESCAVERTWFNRAHPGKFYIRSLAQRIAHSPVYDSLAPARRAFFSNFSGAPNIDEDRLTALGGASINYYPASPNGGNGLLSPVRFSFRKSAFIELAASGDGASTSQFLIPDDGVFIAQVFLSMTSGPLQGIELQVQDSTGRILAKMPVGGMRPILIQDHRLSFYSTAGSYIRVVVVSTVNTQAAVAMQQVDVFKSSNVNGPAISRPGSKIVVLGDSWVAGDLASTPEREPLTQQLALELPGAQIINAGRGGNTSSQMWARWQTDVAPHAPDVVVILTGTNDCYNPESAQFDPNAINVYTQQIRLMIQAAYEIGAQPIIVGMPALCQSDPEVPGLAEWVLNQRAQLYAAGLFEQLARKPLANGGRTGALVIATDAVVTAGTQPEVSNKYLINLAYAAPTNVTYFVGGVRGQEIEVYAANGNTKLIHGQLILAGGADVTLTQHSIVRFRRANPLDSAAWFEISRSIK